MKSEEELRMKSKAELQRIASKLFVTKTTVENAANIVSSTIRMMKATDTLSALEAPDRWKVYEDIDALEKVLNSLDEATQKVLGIARTYDTPDDTEE